MKPHKVIFFTGLSSSGGAEQAMVSLSKYFSDSLPDWQARLVVLLKEPMSSTELGDFAPGAVTRLNARRTFSSLKEILRILRRENPSFVVSSLPHVSATVSVAHFLSRTTAVHLVRLESGLHAQSSHSVLRRLKSDLVRKLLSRARHFIVVAEEMAPEFARVLGRRIEDFTFIPNPVVQEPRRLKARDVLAHEDGNIRLVAVGRLAREKNLSLAISVVEKLKKMTDSHVHLLIFGDGPERKDLEAEVLFRGLEKDVTFGGFVRDKAEIYSAGDLLIVSSLYEGFPLNVIEALAFGLGVISVDCDFGPREIIHAPWQGSLTSYDPQDMATSVLRFVEGPFAYDDSMRKKRSDYAFSNFSLEQVAFRHERLFLSLVDGR